MNSTRARFSVGTIQGWEEFKEIIFSRSKYHSASNGSIHVCGSAIYQLGLAAATVRGTYHISSKNLAQK